jgi:hypothetical protein
MKTLISTGSKNLVFGTGVSACAIENFEAAISTAAANRDNGVIGLVYIWTIDKASSMANYIKKGANAMMTNNPSTLLNVVKEMGLTLAVPETPIPVANSSVVSGGGSCNCDCDYHPGGCVISKLAPVGKACKCTYKGGWTCGGSTVACKSATSPYCKRPDTTVNSCKQGGGDCDGYKR